MANSVDPTRTPAPIILAQGASTVKGARIEGPTVRTAAMATTASMAMPGSADPRIRTARGVAPSRMAAAVQTTMIAPQQATSATNTSWSIALTA